MSTRLSKDQQSGLGLCLCAASLHLRALQDFSTARPLHFSLVPCTPGFKGKQPLLFALCCLFPLIPFSDSLHPNLPSCHPLSAATNFHFPDDTLVLCMWISQYSAYTEESREHIVPPCSYLKQKTKNHPSFPLSWL